MATQPQSRSWGDFPLRKLVEEVCQSLATQCEEQAIDTLLDIPANLIVRADQKMIRRAVEHLVRNAIAAMPKGGSLLATSVVGADAVELEIADTGVALTDEARRHVFDLPENVERGGSAWELAMVRRIAEMHGGSVTATNCPDGGVALTLRIPRRKALEAAA